MEARIWRLLSVTGIIACLMVAEARANPEVAYAIPVSNLTIDGRLDDWPGEMVWVSIDRVLESSYFESIAGAGPLLQPGDFSGRFTAGYDSTENTVFVAIEVEDQTDLVDEAHQGTTVVGNADWSLWDGCEVYLDLTHGKQPGRIQQIALYGGKQNLSFQGKKTKVERFRVGNLTTYEWSIDASSEKPAQMLSAGMAIGFDIAICDRDGDDSFSWISWTPGSSKPASPERVGTLRLLEQRAEFANLNIQVGIQDHRGKHLDNLAPYGSLVGVRLMAGSEIAGAGSADSLGNCRFRLPEGRYSVHAWGPGVGDTIHVADIAVNDTMDQSLAVLLKDRGAAFFVDAAADSNGTGTSTAPFARLGQAIAASGPGDTIYAAAGKYPEGIELHWGVHLIGVDSRKTVLEGKDAKILFRDARGGTIQGVTVRGGKGIGLVNCRHFRVQSNILNGNRADVGAGILVAEGRDLTIAQNLIAQNQAEVGGGGIAIIEGDSTVEITGNLIAANSATPSTPEGQQQANGKGGGIMVEGGNPVIRNNTIIYNHAAHRGGGVIISGLRRPARPEIANNIVAHNDHGGVFSWYQGVPNLHHNNVWNNSEWDYLGCEPGPKSFSEDPQFIDPLGGDFRLNHSSSSQKKGDAPEHHLGASGEVASWSLKTNCLPPPDTLRLWVGPKKQNPPPLEKYHIVPIAERDKSLVIDRGLPREQVALDSLEAIPLNRDFTTYTTKDGLAGNMVLGIELARDGVLWFSTNQGLSRYDGTWRTFTPKDGLAAPMIQDLCVDPQRRVWCATKEGLSVYDGKEWVTHLAGQNVTSVAVDSAGVVWGTTVEEFFRYDGRAWEFYLVAPFMVPGFPFGISLIDSHNRIYVGALRYDNDQWAAYSATGTAGLEMPVGMTEDRDGQIWYANLQVSGGQYSSQISHFDGKGWVNYVLPSSLQGYMATMPVEDPQGNIWVTASRGLLRFDGKTWCRIADWDKMPPCLDAVSAPDGTLWIGTNGGGVVRIGKPSWAGLEGVSGQKIVGLHLDDQGALWRATDDGLRRLSADGQETVFRTPEGLLSNQIYCMVPDGKGGLWLGTDGGLSYYHPQAGWRSFRTGEGMPKGTIQSLLVGRDSTLWVGTSAGLGQYDGQTWRLFGPADGLDTPDVLSLWEGEGGTLWIGTRGGVFCRRAGRMVNLLEALRPEVHLDVYSLAAEKDDARLDSLLTQSLEAEDRLWWLTVKLDEVASRNPEAGARLLEAMQRWVVADTSHTTRFVKFMESQASVLQQLDTPEKAARAALIFAGNKPVYSLFRDQGQRLWVATDRGLFSLKDSLWSFHEPQAGLGDNRVERILQDRKGRLWFLGPEGATRYDGTNWVVFNTEDGLPDQHVLSLIEDGDGTAFFGTAKGLAHRRPDTTPPNTDIVEGPEGIHTEPQVLFRFVGGDPETGPQGLSFSHAFSAKDQQPKLEDWSPYSTEVFAKQAFLDGSYTFHVRARDKEGNVDPSPATRSFTVRTEEVVQIAQVDLDPVFPAVYHWYSRHRLGTVKLANKSNAPLKAVLRLHIPEYMDVPTEEEVVLPPESITEVDLHAVFADRIAKVTQGRQTPIHVELIYVKEGQQKTTKNSSMGMIHGNNALSWRDPRMAAAFITSTEEGVSGFARGLLQRHREQLVKGADRSLSQATVLFDGLGAFGVRYVQDPNSAYAQVSAAGGAVDQIQYPAQFLESKAGDCDDCTMLYCSLLENIGIPTAMVDAPGHIFMMFDTGIEADRQEILCLESNQYVVYQDRVWIPVEVTMLGESFAKAWQLGAEATSYLGRAGQLRIFPVAQAWEEFQPAAVGFAKTFSPPDSAALKELARQDREELLTQRDLFLQRHFLSPLKKNPENHPLRAELARVYVYLNRLDEGLAEYRNLIATGYEPAATYNNMGIAQFVAGDLEGAVASFRKAVDLAPAEEGFAQNLEFALHRQVDQQEKALSERQPATEDPTKGNITPMADRFWWAGR